MFLLMRRIGLPTSFLSVWEKTLAQVKRRFRVHGSLSQPAVALNGFPEGDPLSVIPMVLIGQAFALGEGPCKTIDFCGQY